MLKIFWLLGLIFFACFVGTTLAQAQNQADSPIIIKVAGKAEILAQGRRLKAREGQILAPGQSIQLIGGGEVRLSTSNGKIKVKVFDDTIVKFDGQVEANSQPWSPPTSQYEKTSTTPSSHKAPQFVVPVGKLEVQVEPGQELRVVCPLIMAAVRGTLFTVNVSNDGTSRVETLDGRVATYGRNGEIHLTSSGQSSQVTARAYVSFLANKGVDVPPSGNFEDIPAATQENVDNDTLGNIFGSEGAGLLAAVLANPDANPTDGVNALAIETLSAESGSIFVDSPMETVSGQFDDPGNAQTMASSSSSSSSVVAPDSPLLDQGLPVVNNPTPIGPDTRVGYVTGSFSLPGAITTYINNFYFTMDFVDGAIKDAGFEVEYSRLDAALTLIQTYIGGLSGGTGQLDLNNLSFSLSNFKNAYYAQDVLSPAYKLMGTSTYVTGQLGALDFNQALNGRLNLAYTGSPTDMPSYLDFAGQLKDTPATVVSGSLALLPGAVALDNYYKFSLDLSSGAITNGDVRLNYIDTGSHNYQVVLRSGVGSMPANGQNFSINFSEGQVTLTSPTTNTILFQQPPSSTPSIVVGFPSTISLDYRGVLTASMDRPLANIGPGARVTSGRLDLSGDGLTFIPLSLPSFFPYQYDVQDGEVNPPGR